MPARLEEEHTRLADLGSASRVCDDETRARQIGDHWSEDAEVFRNTILLKLQASLRRHSTDEEEPGRIRPGDDEEGESRR